MYPMLRIEIEEVREISCTQGLREVHEVLGVDAGGRKVLLVLADQGLKVMEVASGVDGRLIREMRLVGEENRVREAKMIVTGKID
jgi:N-acetylglucosamine kinase-like BadF-type ATPase